MFHTFEKLITINGVTVGIDPQIMSDRMVERITSGRYERNEAKHLPRILKPGSRVMELGGGIGYISALVAKTAPESLVVIEANPSLIPIIQENHRINGVSSSIINCVATIDPDIKSLPFYIAEDFWASSLKRPRNCVRTEVVRAKLFSRLIEKYNPNVIIMDIEGGELDLIPNADLGNVELLYVEVHPKVIGLEGVRAVFDGLSSQGFAYDAPRSSGGVVLFRKIPLFSGKPNNTSFRHNPLSEKIKSWRRRLTKNDAIPG